MSRLDLNSAINLTNVSFCNLKDLIIAQINDLCCNANLSKCKFCEGACGVCWLECLLSIRFLYLGVSID